MYVPFFCMYTHTHARTHARINTYSKWLKLCEYYLLQIFHYYSSYPQLCYKHQVFYKHQIYSKYIESSYLIYFIFKNMKLKQKSVFYSNFFSRKFYNFNNEILEISSIYIIWVIWAMYWWMCMHAWVRACMRACACIYRKIVHKWHLESRVLETFNFKIPFYYRYIDNLVMAVPTSKIEVIIATFNSIHLSLQFTSEIGHMTINFLDTTIMIRNNRILFDWFHKPTFLGRYLNYLSQHPLSQKKNTIMGLVDRVFLLSHPEEKKILHSSSESYWRMITRWDLFLTR